MKLPSKVRFADKKIQKAFEELINSHKNQKRIYDWLIRAFQDIKENAFCVSSLRILR